MALTDIQKQAILRGINTLPVQNVVNFIDKGDLTLEECLEHGLDHATVEEINNIKEQAASEQQKMEEDAEFYTNINNDELDIEEIHHALRSGSVTEEGLLENTVIDEQMLTKIKQYDEEAGVQPMKNELPVLDGYTDIFFFGKSESGKTCILASIFLHGKNKGLFIDDSYSQKGINYKNAIVRGVQNGILPEATQADPDAITYITTELHSEDGQVNPLNIVEMSGEFFTRAAEDPQIWENTIDAHGYLSNKNKKLLLFIVDFKKFDEGENYKKSTQEDDFTGCLNILKNYEGVLDNTYCVYIIVNKSDKFPPEADVNKDAYAQAFFKEKFTSFYKNLQVTREKYGFEIKAVHFSLGEFIFKNSYLTQFNSECPANLIDSISKQASRRKGGGLFGKIFGDE